MPPTTVQFKAENAKLITRVSADRAGLSDYVTKRDFRRDLDEDIRREGYDYFWPNITGAMATNPGNQPFPNAPNIDEPITLVHHARRPNGKHTIIVGTQTKLWRFFALEDGAYFEGTGASAYFEHDNESPENPLAYFENADGDWLLIGSGFSVDGHRWEAVDINGYTVLNNGVDLPMTYRIEDAAVLPIYELREQGIAAVGTIGETNGILHCADISEIHTDALKVLMSPVGDISGGNMTAQQSATTVTTPADFFTNAHVGRRIVWEDGTTAKITAFTNARTVTVSTNATLSSKRFTLRNKGTQAGASFSGTITATNAGAVITASGAFFDGGMVSKTIRFSNGFSSLIDTFTDATHVTIHDVPPDAIAGLPFWITNASSLVLVADSNAFDNTMVGRNIVFDNGQVRTIQAFTDAKTVAVDTDSPITDEYFQLQNLDSYKAYTDLNNIDRVQYRDLWSMPDEPRRFGVIIPGTMTLGSQSLELDFPSQSFASGDEIIVAGAGIDGGNITTTVLSVSELGKRLLLADTAQTAIISQPVEQADANGSIVGFEDLQDDSSAILRLLSLEDFLIVYKETCIFVGVYTGNVDQPFQFKRVKIPKSIALVYRWTLINVGGQYHMYAGANSFYRFDLATRAPQLVQELDVISDKFFSQVTIDQSDEIFAADSSVTNEVFFWFPSATADKALCYDYRYNSASTTGVAMTAAATCRKPVVNAATASELLFVMGNAQGVVLVYGRADSPQTGWSNAKEIFYVRSAYPFASGQNGYDSQLEKGWGDFSNPHGEKDLTNFVLYLASQSPDCGLLLQLYGTRNPNDTPELLVQNYIVSPKTENLVPVFFRQHYYKSKLTISGKNNPCRIAGETYDVELIGSQSHERRP